jgi:hypothetical protein
VHAAAVPHYHPNVTAAVLCNYSPANGGILRSWSDRRHAAPHRALELRAVRKIGLTRAGQSHVD